MNTRQKSTKFRCVGCHGKIPARLISMTPKGMKCETCQQNDRRLEDHR